MKAMCWHWQARVNTFLLDPICVAPADVLERGYEGTPIGSVQDFLTEASLRTQEAAPVHVPMAEQVASVVPITGSGIDREVTKKRYVVTNRAS